MSKRVVWIFKEDHWVSLQSGMRHLMWTCSLLTHSHSLLEQTSWPTQDSEGKRLKYHHYNSVSSDLPITACLPSPPPLKAPLYHQLWNLALMFRLTKLLHKINFDLMLALCLMLSEIRRNGIKDVGLSGLSRLIPQPWRRTGQRNYGFLKSNNKSELIKM